MIISLYVKTVRKLSVLLLVKITILPNNVNCSLIVYISLVSYIGFCHSRVLKIELSDSSH